MAIRDLLWACPVCGRESGLRKGKGGEVCAGCGTIFRRASGASIEARRPDGTLERGSTATWLTRLPRLPGGASASASPRSTPVLARFAEGEQEVRAGGELLGRIERLGPKVPGRLSLSDTELAFHPDEGRSTAWALRELTALQCSSSTLQIKARGRPVVSFRLRDESVRLWESLIEGALRRVYAAQGREILEFQPRICLR